MYTDGGGNLTHEESMWHYIGRNWFRLGLAPYEGGVDNKSPLIFAVFGLSDYLFGLNFWFPRLLGIAVQTAGIYFLYKIVVFLAAAQGPERARPVLPIGRQTAIITITIYGLSLLWRGTGGKYVSFTETYAMTFLIIAIYYYLRYHAGAVLKNGGQTMPPGAAAANDHPQRTASIAAMKKHGAGTAFISGLMAGIAFGWRISACFGIAAILFHALLKNRKALLPFASGVAAALATLTLLAIAARIDISDIYRFAFAENFGAGSTTDHSFGWKADNFIMSFFYSEMVVFYPFVAIYFLLREQFALPTSVYALLTIWLLFEFIGINILGIYARPHFKHLLPVLSLMSGVSIMQIAATYGLPVKRVLLVIWILFIPKVTEPLRNFITIDHPGRYKKFCAEPYPHPDERAERRLGQWLSVTTKPGDYVLVAGYGARVQLYSKRLSPTAYFNVTQTPRAKQQFMQEVSSNKPAVIAVPVYADYTVHVQKDLRAFIDSLVANEYIAWEDCVCGYRLYKKRSP